MNELSYYTKQFDELLGKSIDWHIKGWKFKYGTDEWKICQLKSNIYRRKANIYLLKMQKIVKQWTA